MQVRQLKEEVDLEKQAHEQATRALNQAKADLARRTEQLENLTKGACHRWRGNMRATMAKSFVAHCVLRCLRQRATKRWRSRSALPSPSPLSASASCRTQSNARFDSLRKACRGEGVLTVDPVQGCCTWSGPAGKAQAGARRAQDGCCCIRRWQAIGRLPVLTKLLR